MGKIIQIALSDEQEEYLRRQSVSDGAAETYVSELIDRDRKFQGEAAKWLYEVLSEPAAADEETYIAVSAEDVILRNKSR